MTKRQKMLLNKATIQRKEHYKMYKSGSTWAFTCIVLMAGVFWSVPTVTAQAAGTPTDTATKQVVTGSSTQQGSSTGTTNGTPVATGTNQTPTASNAATTQTATSVKSATTATPSATTSTSTDGSTTTPTQNQITTANLNSTNPANLNADGTVSRTDMTNVKTSSVQDVQDNFKAQRISKVNGTVQKPVNISDTISNGGVTLVPAATANTAGTLVFKNQIDTSQAFTFNATFTSSMTGGGGGIGFLLQPVDPQDAGVGEGSDPSADIGIYCQPNTTFIGRDGYVDTSDNSKKADTDWTNLTIRQTDSNGLLTGSTPTWSNSSSPAKPSNATIPLTEYATLTWTPTSGVVDHKVTGTLTYTTYKDAARTQQVQTLTTSSATYIPTTKLNSITLNQSVSIAAFGATGNENDKRSVQVASTTGAGASEGGFTAKVNTMPIKITYVDQDGSTPLHDADTTNVNVGDSLTIASTTDLNTNTFAPRVINGYRFVKAVASDGTDTITVSNSVLNALTSNPNVNNIVVYYTNKVSYTIQPVNALGQNIAGLASTQGTATIGDSITAPTYTGYVPSTPSVLAPTTDGTTLKLAYSAVASSVTVSYEGLPTSLPANTVNGSIGSTYNIVSPTVPGYTADQAALSGTFATEGNTKLTVKYTPSSNSYQVIPVDEYQKVIATLPVQTESSTTGDPIVAPTYAGYKLVDSINLPTTQGGVSSYQLSYQAIPYNVQVTYTGLPAGQQQSTGSAEGTIGTVYQINSPIVAGYTPDKPSITGTFTDGGTTSFTVNYTADNAIYKVQPVDANNVPITTLEPQLFNGTTGDPIETPTYAGYTVQPTDEKVPVPASVTPTINVKYTANPSSVTVTYAGLPASSTVAKSATFKGVTDATYQITVPTVAGYTPNVSVLNGIYSNAGSDTKTITYTPNDNSYTITPVDADGNPIAGLSTVSASTKTDAQIELPDYSSEGYELVASQSIVTKPGVTNYQVEYRADTQKITVSYSGLPAAEANLAPVQTQTVKVGDSYNFVSPTITGYTPDIPVVSGVYTKGQVASVTVTYTPMKETVTIAATGLDPDSAAQYVAVTQTGNYGDSFSIPVTNVPGYTTKNTMITGTYGADSASNMHAVTYTGQPASVKIVYSVVGNGATTPASVTLTGIVGGSYTQDSPTVTNYVSDQSTVSGMFTAADVTENNATISVKYVTGSNIYVIQPVDANHQPISALSTTTVGTSDGKTVQVPDFSDQGYITDKTTADVADANSSKIINVIYLKQVSYTIQPVGTDNVPISTLSPITTTATVGSQVTPPIEAGYELVNPATTYTISDTTNTVPIQYKVKPVSIALVPVDGNGQAISGLGKWLISNKSLGGTVVNVTPPNYSGYQLKSNDNLNISVPIQDDQLIVPVTYLKMFTAQLTGSESESYTGAVQTPDMTNYKVNLPDGTDYALSANDLQIVPSGATSTVAKNVGTYNVQLTDAAKKAISDSLSQNYAVTVGDNATFTITPAALTVPTANTAKVPVNVSDPAQNPQLATSIVVQGATKVYDGGASTNLETFNVLAPSQYTDFKIPTLSDNDFDISSISQNAGNYEVKLSDKGLQDFQAANPNYQFDATDVQSGLFVITKAPVTIKAANVTTSYTGQEYDDATLKAEVPTQLPAKGDKLVYTLSTNGATDASTVSYPITVNASATDNPNYDITTVSGQLLITPKTDAAIKVGNDSKTYDGTTKVIDAQYKVGLPTGMTEPTWSAGDFDFSGITSANVGDNYSMTLSDQGIADLQKVNPNYAVTRANVTAGNFAITPNTTATVTISNGTKTYDGTTNGAAKQFQVTGSTGITVPTLTDADFDFSGITSANVGSYAVKLSDAGIAALQSANTNYTITSSNVTGGNLVITSNTTAKVQISTGTKVYDGTTNVAATGFEVTGPADMVIPALTASDFDFSGIDKADVGQYSVTLSGAGIAALQSANTNYTITNSNVNVGHLNITPAHITITAPSETVTYNGQVPVVSTKGTVTAQDGAVGTPVNYTISSDVAAGVKDYTTTVNLPANGNANYAITKVNGTVTVKANTSAEVTLSDANKVYDGTTNVAASDFKVTGPADMMIPTLTADDFDFSGIDKADVGQYSVKLSKTGIDALQSANTNYTITNSNVTVSHLNITPAHITITAPSETVTYNGQVPILPKETVTVQDGQIGTPVLYTITNDVQADAGGYTTTVELPTDGNSNYAITKVNGTVTVKENTSAEVTLSDANKVYDGTTNVAATDFKVTGPADMVIPTLAADDFDFSGIDSANVGSYSIKLSDTGVKALQAANKNYTITSSNVTAGNLNITPDTNAKVQINNGAKEYDGTKAVATTSITLNLPTDMNVPTWTIDDFDFSGVTSSNVGNYQISLSDKGINDLQAVNKNYTIARQNVTVGNFQITQKDGLTIDVTGGNKTYDGTAAQYALTLPDGVQTSDNWSAADYSLVAPVNAGTYTVTLSDQGVQDLQNANPNYAIKAAKVTGDTFTISKANVTITAKDESMVYSGQAYNDANLEEDVSGKPTSGADLKYTLTANAATNVDDEGYTIKVIADSADNPNYNIQTVDGKLTITPAPITVTAPTISKTYDGKAYSGDYRVSVDGVPENGVQPAFALTDISGDVNAGAYTLTASSENTGNYAVTYKAGSLTINKADLTASITNQTKVYDNNSAKDPQNYTLQLSTGDQLTLPRSDFKISANNGGDFSQNVGSYTVSLNDDGIAAVNKQMPNYNLATASVSAGQFTITPQQVDAGAISVDSATKVYDGDANTDPETYGLTISDEYPEVVIPADLTADDFDIQGITSQNVGNYAVKLTQSGIEKLNQANTNYLINADSISSGQLQITKRPVTLTADDVQKVYDGHSYNKVGTAKPANLTSSGTPLVYTVNVPKNVDTVSDAPITITADKAANSNYEITTIDGKLTIAAKALAENAITISQATKTYDDDASNVPAFSLSTPDVTANPNFVMPTTLTTADFNTTSAVSQNVGNYDVTLTDSGLQKLQAVNPNYAISAKSIGSGSLSITRKAITINAPTLSKTYDGNAYSGADLTGTVTGQIGDQQIVYGLTDLSQNVNAGNYEIGVNVDSAASVNQNYDIQTAKGQLTINKAPVTIAAPQGLTKMYDGSGYVLHDDTATVSGKPDHGATVNYHLSSLENAVNAGTYSVNVTDTANNPNYDITVVPSTFTVTKNTEDSVQIGSASKTYDNDEDTDPRTYAVTLPAGVSTPDSWSVDDFKLSANSQNVGSYAVTLSDSGIQKLNAANSNYLFNTDNVKAGQLTIKPAPITVTAPSISQTYDGAAYAGDYSAKVSGTPVNATGPSFTLTDISQDVNAGTYGIQATATGDISNYAITYVDGMLTITPQTLGQATVNSVASPANNDDPADNHQADDFVVVQGATKVYDGDATTDPTTYQVLAPSDYADFNVPTFTAADFTSVSDGQDAGKHVVTLTATGLAKLQAANKNYQFDAQSIQNGLLVITPAPISIAAPNLTKQYDGQAYQESVMPVVTGVPANGVAPVYTLSALNDDVNAGQYPIVVSFSPMDNPNYTISTSKGQLTITPITPQFRVMIDACYQLYSGQPADNQVYPVTISGADLVQPEWTAEDFVVSGTPDAVGSYPVTLSSAGWKKLQQANPNDVINADPTKITPGALVIEPVSLAKADLGQIQVGSQTKVYDGLNDDPTDYTVTLPAKLTAPVWSASDFERQETSENAGTYSVTLSKSGLTALQAVNPNYVINAEDITSGQLTITKAPITITAPSGLSKTDDGKPYSGTTTGKVTGQPVNGSAVVYQVDYGNNGSVGTHLASIVADPKLNPNYEITTVSNNYQILPQPVVASTTDATKTVEAQFKQAVAEPVFYPAESKSGSTIKQVTLQIPATKELDQAKEIVASAPERAELIFSSQTGSASEHGQSSSKHSTSSTSKQGVKGRTQETKQSNPNYTSSSNVESGNASFESRTAYQRSMKLKRQSANPSTIAGAKHLPQTDETQSSLLAVLGATLMSLLGMLGVKKRKSDQ